jgi:response regulator of citrate/malate metabolism
MDKIKFLNTEKGANIQIITPEVLSDFANELVESTARRIIAELNTPDKPLTEKQVCQQIGKTRQTLAKYRKDGRLRYHRIGREIYYFPSELKQDIKNF